MRKTLIMCVIAFIIGFLICLDPMYLYRSYEFNKYIESISTKVYLNPRELVPFQYDNLYVIYPYTSKNDIQKQIGFKSRHIKESNNDKYQTIIITRDDKIIASVNVSFIYSFQSIVEDNKISSRNDTIIKVFKHDSGYSFIEQYKTIEDSYCDIKFVLPGSYWEEDDEEDGKFYYLDIDSDEYLLVTKDEKFSYKKYIKGKSISKEEDVSINDYKAKYLEITKNDSIDIVYIVSVNDTIYVFRLNSLEENVDENKKDLYNIIQSVKE